MLYRSAVWLRSAVYFGRVLYCSAVVVGGDVGTMPRCYAMTLCEVDRYVEHWLVGGSQTKSDVCVSAAIKTFSLFTSELFYVTLTLHSHIFIFSFIYFIDDNIIIMV